MDTIFRCKRNKNYEVTKAQTTPWAFLEIMAEAGILLPMPWMSKVPVLIPVEATKTQQ